QGTLSFNGGTHDIACILSTNRIIIINGNVNFNAAYSFAGTVNLSGGVLGGSGDVTIAGTLNWATGPMSGTGRTIIAAGGTLTINNAFVSLLRRLENHSANATLTNSTINFSGGTLSNESDGTFTVNLTSNFAFQNNGGTNLISNAGTFNKTGAGILSIGGGTMSLNNSGTLNLDAGALNHGGGGANTGTIDADAGTTLTFGASYT